MSLLEIVILIVGLGVIGYVNYKSIRRSAKRLQETLKRD